MNAATCKKMQRNSKASPHIHNKWPMSVSVIKVNMDKLRPEIWAKIVVFGAQNYTEYQFFIFVFILYFDPTIIEVNLYKVG